MRSSSSKFLASTISSSHKNRAETSKLCLDLYGVIQLLVVILVDFGVLLDTVQLPLERYCSRQIMKLTTLISPVLFNQDDDDDDEGGKAKGENSYDTPTSLCLIVASHRTPRPTSGGRSRTCWPTPGPGPRPPPPTSTLGPTSPRTFWAISLQEDNL